MQIWSFFSGGMGLDLGLEAAGLAPTLCVELDPECCQTIRLNKPHLKLIEEDINRLTVDQLRTEAVSRGDVYLVVGGPPCQTFSPAGNRAALSDPRGNLIYVYLKLISEIRPQNFILENVAHLTTAALRHRPIAQRPGQHWNLSRYDSCNDADEDSPPLDRDEKSGSAVRQVLRDVESLGYHITFGILDAADFGAPQHRLRFVMLGTRDHAPIALPRITHGRQTSPYVTVRDSIWDLRLNPGPHSVYTPEIRRYFELIPAGGNWRNLPDDLKEAAMGKSFAAGGGKTGFFRRLSWDRPAPTITGRPNRKATALCHPEFTRPLSVRECARLQGFPDSWMFHGSMNAQYVQIGNAVPTALGAALGKAIMDGRPPADLHSSEVQLELALRTLRASARNKSSVKRESAHRLDLV